jgi:hypothetical protein
VEGERMNDPEPDELEEKLEEADPNRVEFPRHVYERARKRNVDVDAVKQRIRDFDFSDVRPNNQSDSSFDYSFKVTVDTGKGRYEAPIYFNVPANKLLVKSVWPK